MESGQRTERGVEGESLIGREARRRDIQMDTEETTEGLRDSYLVRGMNVDM